MTWSWQRRPNRPVQFVLSSLRRLWLFAVLAVPLFGYKDSVYEVMNADSELAVTSAPDRALGQNELVLEKNLGELVCWARVSLEAPPAGFVRLRSWIDRGVQLEPISGTAKMGIVSVDLRPVAKSSPSSYFEWPSGYDLRLAHDGSALVLRDWIVWAKDGVHTSEKASIRSMLDWVFAIVLGLGIVGALGKALAEAKGDAETSSRPTFSGSASDYVLPFMIESVKGDNAKQTVNIRKFLRDVLIGKADPKEAAGALGLSYGEGRSIGIKAVTGMTHRIEALSDDVSRWKAILAQSRPT